MKLRNKKTGEIRKLPDGFFCGDNLKKICEEWEDYEEPTEYWCIDWTGGVNHITVLDDVDKYEEDKKQIGNYFETKEEAEKAVEKLKAWTRLVGKGFEFESVGEYELLCGNGFEVPIRAIMPPECYADEEVKQDLIALFGGEE